MWYRTGHRIPSLSKAVWSFKCLVQHPPWARGYIPNKGRTITGSQNPGPTKPNHTKPGCMCHKGKNFIESCHFFTIERLISKNAGELSDSLPGGGSVDQSHGGVRKSDGISASYRLTFRLTSCPSAIGVTKPCGVAYKKVNVVID